MTKPHRNPPAVSALGIITYDDAPDEEGPVTEHEVSGEAAAFGALDATVLSNDNTDA